MTMTGQLHTNYQCHCQVPVPGIVEGEDTGLCASCKYVYDERLYEMRLRQHVPDWHYDTIDQYLTEVDPVYRALVA
jgi:hypothetical protein